MKTLFDAVDRMQGVLAFHRDRHALLAGNIANVNTPGYVPFDLVLERIPKDFETGGALGLVKTQPEHMGPKSAEVTAELVFDDPGTTGGDGNAVNLERELAKIDANRVRYATTTELVSRRLALLKYAASDGR